MYIHKCTRQFRQSDWTKLNHVGGVLTDGKDTAYQSHSSAYKYVSAVCHLFCATRDAHLNQSECFFFFGFTQQNKIDTGIYEIGITQIRLVITAG